MWYRKYNTKELVYTRPIVAQFNNLKQLLIPQINKSYDVIGFNWLNLNDGTYGSCVTWETPEKAVIARYNDGWEVYNVRLDVLKDGDY